MEVIREVSTLWVMGIAWSNLLMLWIVPEFWKDNLYLLVAKFIVSYGGEEVLTL